MEKEIEKILTSYEIDMGANWGIPSVSFGEVAREIAELFRNIPKTQNAVWIGAQACGGEINWLTVRGEGNGTR